MLIDTASLSGTLDAVNAAHFEGRTLTAAERRRDARWIAGRQGLPGAYAGTCSACGIPASQHELVVRTLNSL